MKPTTREWVKKAENDFKVASQILLRRKDIVPDAACFFCQQCVEKYLKARCAPAVAAFIGIRSGLVEHHRALLIGPLSRRQRPGLDDLADRWMTSFGVWSLGRRIWSF